MGNNDTVNVGIDVGSTTTKICAIDARTHELLLTSYERHGAHQVKSVQNALRCLARDLPGRTLRLALTGSGSKAIATKLGVPFVQEVVANAAAVQELYPRARCAIELGGQDAKMIFFRPNPTTGALEVADMRMNGSCAGGTGAFIDEIASVLNLPIEHFNDAAQRGTRVHDISGRCGVYAKTDIQPLLNQGVSCDDLALSAFHAIAKQTLGGLAQGIDVEAPVIFEGGPLTFNPVLIDVFSQRLELRPHDAIVPEHPETMVARGAALSLSGMFADTDAAIDALKAAESLEGFTGDADDHAPGAPLFKDADDLRAFKQRHQLPAESHGPKGPAARARTENGKLRVWVGIDSGSTTTKLALLADDGELVDSFYANNEGEPLEVARRALIDLRDAYAQAGVELEVAGLGTTGYGELLFNRAFHADYHTVETVAHAHAAAKYAPDVSFILDIGGQDMKAMWLSDGVICDIVVNEACSSGCGSFLENFAHALGIPTTGIADAAFASTQPAVLGSRCTVFMNSSIVSEQKNGRTPDDIMAGLCRSIIANVFTKVVRVPNLDALGDHIVVQGGTFKNDAVLRALEQHLGKDVVRAPYPGLMGAIGVAMLTREQMTKAEGAGAAQAPSAFIGLAALDAFTYRQQANCICPFCANRCNRTIVTFADGSSFVTGNRCPRGEVIGDPADATTKMALKAAGAQATRGENLFDAREKLLFQNWPVKPVCPDRGITIGIPRVLAFWDTMPFWNALLRSLGFSLHVSRPSTRAMFEQGLPQVTSDTICFPAKLVHGHVRELARAKVDRIFMPIVTTVPTENAASTSISMCAVVKGYPMVVKSSDDPQRRWNIPFDTPLFHWYSTADRDRQLQGYFADTFGIPAEQMKQAIEQADNAQRAFKSLLIEAGGRAISAAQAAGDYAIVLASRPYHNDPLVNHDLPRMLAELGHAVLPPDAVPGHDRVDLSASRLDIVNNFHERMLACAILAADNPALEYVQLVSFGCGHDAYLSDEIVRLMRERSDKAPLILKLDESDVAGPLRIRVRSFLETVDERRGRQNSKGQDGSPAAQAANAPRELPDPYPVKFTKADRKIKTILVPNTSHAFCRLMSATFTRQGVKAVPLEIGREHAIELGKRYVHNDICFPAQMTIGESLAALESGQWDPHTVAIGTGKYIGDCRLTHYAALLRKALDDAGYDYVPIITNDDVDAHDMHPGFRMSLGSAIRIAMGLPMIDALEELLRKMRPYELEPGSADAAFEAALDCVMDGVEAHGTLGAERGFKQAIDIMSQVKYDRSNPRPTVLIVGEYLLNFHPGANRDIEAYLERNGMEVIEARMTDVIRKTYFYQDAQAREFHVTMPLAKKGFNRIANKLFEHAHDVCDKIATAHPLYRPACRMPELVVESDPIIHHTFDAGEGVLIPGEILHHAAHGCRAFVILQPFGCLPNHVVGRGIVKQLKERYPDANILPLDYDPDVSFANVENRLQMLIMNAKGANGPGNDTGCAGCAASTGNAGRVTATPGSTEPAQRDPHPEDAGGAPNTQQAAGIAAQQE